MVRFCLRAHVMVVLREAQKTITNRRNYNVHINKSHGLPLSELRVQGSSFASHTWRMFAASSGVLPALSAGLQILAVMGKYSIHVVGCIQHLTAITSSSINLKSKEFHNSPLGLHRCQPRHLVRSSGYWSGSGFLRIECG